MPLGDPDRKIYQRLLRGDLDAIDLLMRKHGRLLRRIIANLLGDSREEDVEEVLSDVFLASWRDIEEYDPRRARLKTWLVMKARYYALRRREKLSREARVVSSFPPPGILVSQDADLVLAVDLAQALLKLKPSDRQIIYRCDYEGRSRQTVANELNMKTGTLYTRLARIRRRLRRSLRAWGPEEKTDG